MAKKKKAAVKRPERWLGRSAPRKEGPAKVTGRARYIDDLVLPNLWHGLTLRSPVARGKLKGIHLEGDLPWDEFVLVTAKDVPGKNCITLIDTDQPCLADGFVNHPEEAVALLAHPDKHLLEKARRHVRIEIEPMPAVFTLEESLAKKTVIWGKDNVFKSYLLEKGKVDTVWDKADFIVEGEYRTGAQEQLYIENNGMIAAANAEDGITIWGSMQCPYYVHKALLPLFALPAEKVRIVQTETGGGFGGKEEYPSILAAHAALLALKCGHPVKVIYDRAEDMVATTKRHPSRTRHRTAVSRDGKILAMDIEFVIDGGAYLTLSPVVLSRGTIHAAGPYDVDHVRIRASAVATNTPPNGAFRGFGAPQSLFALERHMNKIAKKLGLTPIELRKRNFLKPGRTTATGQIMRDEVDMSGLLDRALVHADYEKKRKAFLKSNVGSPVKKGIGFATFFHGAGFTGSGEKYLASKVGAEATPKGRVIVLTASTEIGQGTNTIFSQIAADAIGIGYDDVEVAQPDTKYVPNSGPTVASRTCMVVGSLVGQAAESLKLQLVQAGFLKEPVTSKSFRKACAAYHKKIGPLKAIAEYKQPPQIQWDDQKYQGDAYGAYAWAVYVAEVSVDTRTFETRVEDFVALQEVGRVVHPTFAAGQIIGGVAQGIGFALYEKVVWKDGRMANNRMTNYIMPTSADLGPIRAFFEEQPYAYGPGGAKGIGELPMDGPAPAILNAIESALNLAVDEIPLTPELLMETMEVSRAR